MNAVIWILSGLLAGTVARLVMRGRYQGFVADATIGVLGGVTGSWLLTIAGGEAPADSRLAQFAVAVLGAMALVGASRLVMVLSRQATRYAGEAGRILAVADLEKQIGRVSDLERKVLSRMLGRPTSRDPNEVFSEQLTFGQRVADRVATFGESWTFLGLFAAFLLGWMYVNIESPSPYDPYPFILLNLILSCVAATQAPVIMMSQNRSSARDRFDAEQDHQVNLRAEMQIMALHEKYDARSAEVRELAELQRKQWEILERIEQRLAQR